MYVPPRCRSQIVQFKSSGSYTATTPASPACTGGRTTDVGHDATSRPAAPRAAAAYFTRPTNRCRAVRRRALVRARQTGELLSLPRQDACLGELRAQHQRRRPGRVGGSACVFFSRRIPGPGLARLAAGRRRVVCVGCFRSSRGWTVPIASSPPHEARPQHARPSPSVSPATATPPCVATQLAASPPIDPCHPCHLRWSCDTRWTSAQMRARPSTRTASSRTTMARSSP